MRLIKTVACLLVYICIVYAPSVYAMDKEYVSSLGLSSTAGKQRFINYLNIFPRIIVDGAIKNCHKDPNDIEKLVAIASKIKSAKSCSEHEGRYVFQNICDSLNLSPQTFLRVVSTCKAIVNRQPFDPAVLALTHEPAKELHNKLTLIDQMPRIIGDIARKQPEEYYVTKLMCIMFTTNINELNMMNGVILHTYGKTQREAIINKIGYYVVGVLERSFRFSAYISPHTVSRMAQEMRDWVFEKKPVSSDPYDEPLEIEKGRSIMERFPSTIRVIFFNDDYHMKRLVGYAYMLEHPQDQEVIEYFLCYHAINERNNYRSEIEHHIKQVLEKKPDSCGPYHRIIVVKDEATVKKLTDEFIATFTATQIPQSMPPLSSVQAVPLG